MAELSQVCQACARVKYFDSQSFADIIAAVKAENFLNEETNWLLGSGGWVGGGGVDDLHESWFSTGIHLAVQKNCQEHELNVNPGVIQPIVHYCQVPKAVFLYL